MFKLEQKIKVNPLKLNRYNVNIGLGKEGGKALNIFNNNIYYRLQSNGRRITMNKYLEEMILLSKWYNKQLADDEFLEKFKLEKIRYRREVPEIAKEKLELLANNLNETEELRESAKRELNRHDFTNKDVE